MYKIGDKLLIHPDYKRFYDEAMRDDILTIVNILPTTQDVLIVESANWPRAWSIHADNAIRYKTKKEVKNKPGVLCK